MVRERVHDVLHHVVEAGAQPPASHDGGEDLRARPRWFRGGVKAGAQVSGCCKGGRDQCVGAQHRSGRGTVQGDLSLPSSQSSPPPPSPPSTPPSLLPLTSFGLWYVVRRGPLRMAHSGSRRQESSSPLEAIPSAQKAPGGGRGGRSGGGGATAGDGGQVAEEGPEGRGGRRGSEGVGGGRRGEGVA